MNQDTIVHQPMFTMDMDGDGANDRMDDREE